jgi:vacuolar-type H+-ATPase subunit I/STV1
VTNKLRDEAGRLAEETWNKIHQRIKHMSDHVYGTHVEFCIKDITTALRETAEPLERELEKAQTFKGFNWAKASINAVCSYNKRVDEHIKALEERVKELKEALEDIANDPMVSSGLVNMAYAKQRAKQALSKSRQEEKCQ